jgi:hypothetical protein
MQNKFIRFAIWFVALVATMFLAAANPLSFDGIGGITYYLPFLAGSFYFITSPIKAKGIFDEPKYLNGIKSLITLLMMLLAAGVKIPLLSQIIDLLGLITGNWDKIGETVTFVLALYGAIRTIFANSDTPIIGPIAKAISPEQLIEPKIRKF